MHIGFLTSDLSHKHGWAHYSLSLLQALRQAGVVMTIVAAHNSPDVEGLSLHRLLPNTQPAGKYSLLRSLRATPDAGRVLRDCDLIHATIEPYAPIGAWLAAGRPFVVTGHGSYVDLLPHRRWPAGRIYHRALKRSHLACVSHYTATVARQVLPGVATTVIPNGIDPQRFADLPLAGVQKQGPTVLSVGAVKLRKGTLELVRAMATVCQTVPAAQCVIIGSLDAAPGYTEQIVAEINALGLANQVHLLGHVPEATLMAWFGAADVFALPSMNVGRKFEGYGLAHMEASAAGLPVIGTTDCGTEDAIDDGITGLLVSQSAVTDALPGAIIALLTNPQRAAQMGAAGRERARLHTWANVAHRMIAFYEKQVLL